MLTYTTSNTLNFKCSMCGYCCQNWGIFVSEKIISDILENNNTFSDFNSSKDFCRITNNLNPIYNALVTMEDGKCIFLDDSCKCKLFKCFGKENGNPLCLSYPFLKLRLKNRYSVVCTLSCNELRNTIFKKDYDVQITSHEKFPMTLKWPAIMLGSSENVCFSQITNTTLTWDAFYFLEKTFIEKAKNNSKDHLWKILYQLAMANKTFMREKNSTLDVDFVRKTFDEIKDEDVSYNSSTENILFFLKRKINLYESTPFKEDGNNIIENDECFPKIKLGIEFRKQLKKWDPELKKLFILKFFSNPANFLVSVQFFWHVFLFYFSFLKILLYSKWILKKEITEKDIIESIGVIEKHFVHDSKIFQFWGQGKRGEKDFSKDSLFSFII